jgi:transposase
MVLLAAEGLPNAEIGRQVGMTRQTVIAWRSRYEIGGIAALADLPRSGRPPVIDESAVIASTLNPPPDLLGVTHWSARLLAEQLSRAGMPISFAEVARIWRSWGLQPHRCETFKFSTDPQLEAKIRDVVGLYLDPPANAVVVCVDEKSQIQALDRTAPLLPMRFEQAEKRTHDYKRHGTTTLFAALEVATGKITADACYQRHRNGEFLAFLKQVAKAHPRVKLHVVADNYATHRHPNVQAWLAKNPRITMHFTPTSASWMNLVEIFFGIITRQAIRRGTFTSVPDLISAIRTYIDAYNQRCEPFRWTKTADQILSKANRQKNSDTRHLALA